MAKREDVRSLEDTYEEDTCSPLYKIEDFRAWVRHREAEAVRKAGKEYGERVEWWMDDYAAKLERGEA